MLTFFVKTEGATRGQEDGAQKRCQVHHKAIICSCSEPRCQGVSCGTTTFCHRPRNLLRRGKMFSFYKSHNTVKVLHAVAPNGFIMFVSKAYGVRASDPYMTANSGLLHHLDYGDEVLADRGFTIADILPIGVELALPSFTKGKQLAARDAVVSRGLAKLRIHVERSIRRMKCFRILKYVPSSYLAKNNHLDHIVAVVAGLCNLQPALIKGPQLKET
ncbi:uncharacterized protein LOC120842447 [Ixodes scapularis]|uniref:uncharacterized protein LOC120842447 n=1 Tax=Ixodes scapularis TaxID=6945 RepID=UPI001A9D93D5|nr:uncharacterized protein LOC120842447 [Ixodes scapularis]